MAIFSLIYVSRSQIDPSDSIRVVDDIVAVSVPKNKRMDITGSLIFTGSHFAQFLEGAQSDVLALMDSIEADPRHTDVIVLDQTTRQRRIFPNWSLAYVGPSVFVARMVTRPIPAPGEQGTEGSAESVSDLIALMRVFAENPTTQDSIFSNADAE